LNKKIKQILILLLLLGVFFTARAYGVSDYLNFEYLKLQKESLLSTYNENQILFISIYFLVYVISVAVSIPGATIFTLAAGAIFGVVLGTVLVSFASTLGATLSFLFSRYLLRDSVQKKFGSSMDSINKGLEQDGTFYLLSLRLIPAIPFFLINLLMGLSRISAVQFFLVSQIGMLPGTLVYVNAGTQIATLNSPKDIFSPTLLLSFVALGLLPLFAKIIVNKIKINKIYINYNKPKSYDYNLVVLGAGAAGLVTSYIGATVKAKVALIEKHKMGGDCLNYGCVPSKAIIATAKKVHLTKKASEYGLKKVEIDFDFKDIMARVSGIIKKIEPNDSIERYSSMGVDCITGSGKILSPFEVEVNGKIITTKNIVVATGAGPLIPNIPGLKEVPYLTSETLWNLSTLPKNLLVIGGGPIGCELSQAFSRLGSKVTILDIADRILPKEDKDVSLFMETVLMEEGITILKSHKILEFINIYNKNSAVVEFNKEKKEIYFDYVLLSMGRKARVSGFGLEELGVKITNRGTIEVNEYLETNYPNIFACGDVAGPYQFTHTASHEAWYASVNALFGIFKKFKADYTVIPWTTFTDPEVSHVGLSEEDALSKNIQFELTKYDLHELDRAITESENKGFVKILTSPGTDKILGVTIVGHNAGEIISEFVLAMKYKIGVNKILGTIHAYPTMAEANKFAAGNWKKARKPENLLKWVEKFHHWRRQ
jgi:dihydrolipoamide dehydrogenase